MTTKELLNLTTSDFNKLFTSENASQARKAVSVLASAANKRLSRFQKSGETSPAIRYIQEHGGRFSVANKNINDLRAEYARAKDFLKMETSAISKWRKVKTTTIASLKKQGVNISNSEWDDFWKAYEKLKQLNPSVSEKRLKYGALDEIQKQLRNDKNISVEKLAQEVNKTISSTYEQREEIENEMDSVSDFFRG